jgi:citrate lyase beta subunit
MTDFGVQRNGASREELDYARKTIALHASAHKTLAIDTPYVEFKNDQGLIEELEYLKKIGIFAKMAIHPC